MSTGFPLLLLLFLLSAISVSLVVGEIDESLLIVGFDVVQQLELILILPLALTLTAL